MFDHALTNRLLASLRHIERGLLVVTTPDGKHHSFEGAKAGAMAQITIHDWRLARAVLHRGDVALAEAYRDGLWDSPDPTQIFLIGLQNQDVLDRYISGNVWGRLAARASYVLTRNTVRGSRKNIHAHYDLGNEFYRLWLDPTMTYSAAIFADSSDDLQAAQTRKYDRLLERVNPTGHLLEIGCGWGGFAERALQKGDYSFKGLTISEAQRDFATQRVGQDATIALEDYRHQQGRYDQIVSIEMFEAVGEEYWPTYFSKVKSLLASKGKALIQTITIANEAFDDYRRSGDAIRTFIFPGGMLPSPERFRHECTKAGLRVTDEFSFGHDYALTLRQWLTNFDSKLADVRAMGFDEPFIRMWRFYLTYCIAAFQHGRTDVMQWELQHAA